jgi:hypothetical protein
MILAPRTALTKPNDADHPRFLESIVGRLLELVVFSVEGIRARVHKLPVH